LHRTKPYSLNIIGSLRPEHIANQSRDLMFALHLVLRTVERARRVHGVSKRAPGFRELERSTQTAFAASKFIE
jgi:hypothetical protein